MRGSAFGTLSSGKFMKLKKGILLFFFSYDSIFTAFSHYFDQYSKLIKAILMKMQPPEIIRKRMISKQLCLKSEVIHRHGKIKNKFLLHWNVSS